MRYAYGVTAALLLGGATLSLMTGLPAGAQVAQNDDAAMQRIAPHPGAPVNFADLTQQLQPAVVNIATRQQVQVQPDFFAMLRGLGPQTRQSGALGSGFIISPDGYVVTNNHVVTLGNQGVADSITVRLADGKDYEARLIGRDAQSDVAVLKIDADKPLPFVELGDSGAARSGDWVLAIGNPFGFGGTVTSGIISNVYRNTGNGAYDHYIQTDAAINSGNSGGPLFDMHGKVIGINTWIYATDESGGNVGIGFAIPANIAKPLVERLKSGKVIERGFLGFGLETIDEDAAEALGIERGKGEFIQSVQPGKAADQAGIKPGDVVLRIDGQDVSPDRSATAIIYDTPPGKRVKVDLLRAGRPLQVIATVGRRPSDEELAATRINRNPNAPAQPARQADNAQQGGVIERNLGLAVTPMTADIANDLGFPPATQGLVILGVDPASDAAVKRLQRLIVILEADDKVMAAPGDLEAVIRAALRSDRKALKLKVQAPGYQSGFLFVRLKTDGK